MIMLRCEHKVEENGFAKDEVEDWISHNLSSSDSAEAHK